MSDQLLTVLGEIQRGQGKLEGAFEEQRRQLEQERQEQERRHRELTAKVENLGTRIATCPYHQPPPPPQVAATTPAEVEARTGFWRQAGKFFGVLTALCGAAWAVVTGTGK